MTDTPLELLDCTIRDGGYVNDWRFDHAMVREVYRAVSKAGIRWMEVGFRSSPRFFDPEHFGPWKFSSEDDIGRVTDSIDGAGIAVLVDHGKCDVADLPPASDSHVELVRLATHKNTLAEAIDFLQAVKAKGYTTSLQCMGYAAYTPAERDSLLAMLHSAGLDYVYVGDSYGSILPFHIPQLFDPLLEVGEQAGFAVGYHPHNNVQMAFANSLAAMERGVRVIDVTAYGIGRGAGNLPAEIMLSYLYASGQTQYNPLPVLEVVERYFEDLMRTHPWGYQLPYMLSGVFNCHPSYAKELLRRREYSMAEIFKGLEYVTSATPTGYDPQLLDTIVKRGVLSVREEPTPRVEVSEGDSPCEDVTPPAYADRHAGRDILVLANGPSLATHIGQVQRFIERYDPIVLGANYLAEMVVPHYHAFNSANRLTSYVQTVHPDSRLLIGSNLPGELVAEYTEREYERLAFRNVLDADFGIACGHVLSNCRTISVLLLGVAIVMGARRLFAAGFDGYMAPGPSHFYDEPHDPREHELNVERHRANQRFLDQIDAHVRGLGGEGVHILTPTSYGSLYKSIDHYLR